jgi:hypothetical protein
MTGWRLTSLIPAMMRFLSSCFEVTRIWRRTERANLEKNPSMRLGHEPCLGVTVSSKRPPAMLRQPQRNSDGACVNGPFDRSHEDRSGFFLLQAASSGSDRMGNAGGGGVESIYR